MSVYIKCIYVILSRPFDWSCRYFRMHSSIYFLAFLSSAFADTVITRYTTDENGVITFEVSTLKMTFKIIFAKLYWLRITHNITAIKIYSSKIISLRCLHRYSLKTQHPFFQKLNKQVFQMWRSRSRAINVGSSHGLDLLTIRLKPKILRAGKLFDKCDDISDDPTIHFWSFK